MCTLRADSGLRAKPRPLRTLFSVHERSQSPFIYVLGTKPWQNVLGTCSRYTSVHITSTVKCSRYRFVQICNRHNSRAAQYDVLCIHCATCEVILMCTLRADSGLRAKPRPLSTLFSVPQRSYLFWRRTNGEFLFREHGLTMFQLELFQREQFSLVHRSYYQKWCVPRTCSENMFPLELYREQV